MTSSQFYSLCILILLAVAIIAISEMLYWWNRWYDTHELLIMEQKDGDELRSSLLRVGRELTVAKETISKLRGKR